MSQTTPPESVTNDAPPPRVRPPLRRSRTDRKLGGVAGGIGAYFDIDPLLVRIGFVVLALAGAGFGLLLYIACLLLIPADNGDDSQVEYFVDRHGRTLAIATGVLVVVALLSASGPLGWAHDNGPWGILLIGAAIAIFVIVRNDRRAARVADGSEPFTAVPPRAPAYAAQYPTTQFAQPPYAQPATPPAPLPPWQTKTRSALGPLTFGVALLTAGVLVALDRGDVVAVPAVVVLASALVVVGLGLVVGGFVGRSRGLIALGVVLTLITAITGAVQLPGNGSLGDQIWAPASVSEVADEYVWGAGELRLDLTAVSSPTPVRTAVRFNVGELTVEVPQSAIVRVHVEVGAGSIGLEQPNGATTLVEGFNREVTTTLEPRRPTAQSTTFDLDIEAGLGQVEVLRATS